MAKACQFVRTPSSQVGVIDNAPLGCAGLYTCQQGRCIKERARQHNPMRLVPSGDLAVYIVETRSTLLFFCFVLGNDHAGQGSGTGLPDKWPRRIIFDHKQTDA